MAGLLKRTIELLSIGRSARKYSKSCDQTVAAHARKTLIEKLGRSKGLPQKIGQIFSMQDNAEIADDFQLLTNASEQLDFSIIESELEKSWGCPLSEVVDWIDETGHAASLGQTHLARLKDGTQVAVKVRYPNIEHAVAADLKYLGWLSIPVGNLKRGFDLEAYRDEIMRDLDEELDYKAEAEHQKRFQNNFQESNTIVVPQIIDRFCTENVLVSSWEEGETIDAVMKGWNKEDRKKLAVEVVRLFAQSIFEHGFIHADPHAGNYRFRQSANGPQIVIYDYGCMLALSELRRLALARLMIATIEKSDDSPLELFECMKFQRKYLEPIKHKLPALCVALFLPFTQNVPFDVSQWNPTELVGDILGEDRWNFRMSGPADLVLLMRAFHGLVYYCQKLGEPVNWHWIVQPILNSIRTQAMDLTVNSTSGSRLETFQSLSKHLVVHVMENGRTKVKVTLPALSINELDHFLEPDIKEKIESRNLNVKQIVQQIRANGMKPQTVIDIEEPPKRFTVSLI